VICTDQSTVGRSRASVDWNTVRKDSFLSSSWDDTIRVGKIPIHEGISSTFLPPSLFFPLITVYVRDVI
jgi:hypothetical protein